MLLPKRVKYRRVHRGRMTGVATRGNQVAYGEWGLATTEPAWITSNQIEAARVAMTRYTKRGGKVWIKIFPDKPVTKKALGTRMGSGKGAPEYGLSPAGSCLKSPACPRRSPARPSAWPATSCRSSARSSRKRLLRTVVNEDES